MKTCAQPPADARAARGVLVAALLGLVVVAAGGVSPAWTSADGSPSMGSDPTRVAPVAATTRVRYGRDVRRILSDRCFQCHGGDAGAREAGLRLDQRASATGGKYPVIVPGDVESSELWWRVTSEDVHEAMPPPRAKKRPISEAELEVLKRWIEQGAEYEAHWAFVAPTRPSLPDVSDTDWGRGAIDRFVLAGLEARGVAPSPAADGATLLRRVFFDLTGLPPTTEELDGFLVEHARDADAALERWVDRIFREEPYRSRLGEHLATSWMDAARFGDTNGIHTDNGRQMWLWRDWVIAAWRDNMPFDQFVTEQLAGDLIPEATVAQRIASGFNRNHVTTDEGGAIPEEYLVEYAIDRASTTSTVFMGLTMGCARCHDHKYDPISQADFYGMVGFFNSVDEPGLYTQTEDAQRAYEPFLEVPSNAQRAELVRLAERRSELVEAMSDALPGEEQELAKFVVEARAGLGLEWSIPEVLSARSSAPDVVLEVLPDSSVEASGPLPDFEDYTFVLESASGAQRALLLEAMATANPDPDSDRPPGAGRASHGNAVVSRVALEVQPIGAAQDAEPWEPVPLVWAWSDHVQAGEDFGPSNVLDGTGLGWAADGNANAGARNLLLVSERDFGFEAGTRLRVTLSFRSPYAAHSLGRVRCRVAPLAETHSLQPSWGGWYRAGPFRPERGQGRDAVYARAFGPELSAGVDPQAAFGESQVRWQFAGTHVDGEPIPLPGAEGLGATYLGRTVWSPDARSVSVELGSDDGFAVFLGGQLIAAREVDRGVEPGQDKATFELQPGANALVLKIVNTGGPAGYAFQAIGEDALLAGSLPSALLPEEAVTPEQRVEMIEAWRRRFSGEYRLLADQLAHNGAAEAALRASIPRTMVMRELAEPRLSFVLRRGQYDHPDTSRPVPRRSPSFLTPLPPGAPGNRLGLARWLTAADNALFARVAVNRFWSQVFGAGLVRTPGDFGLQGDWPTHPELLDWLAVQFRESGWDVHALLRSMVLSATYRQSSVVRADLSGQDPDNRLLARYPRRRLSAEQIRDHALFTAGLLVEQVGGPSVRPYQPEGLWREVAMLASNTRSFTRGNGADLWRRSLYSYWKRAVPPPGLATFDAPTRESCVIQRQQTTTPLQSLVLWNDEQFVEAARVLAQRVLGASTDDRERIVSLFRSCTGRQPDGADIDAVQALQQVYLERFEASPGDAAVLLALGESPLSAEWTPAQVASWTLVASAVFNLHETLTQD